jgi:hypothetical protein
MSINFHSKEHQILVTFRQVLSAVVRDTSPSRGRPSQLTAKTIDEVKHCFRLITAREKEIVEQAGGKEMDSRPQYADEPKTSQVVQFNKPKDKD